MNVFSQWEYLFLLEKTEQSDVENHPTSEKERGQNIVTKKLEY